MALHLFLWKLLTCYILRKSSCHVSAGFLMLLCFWAHSACALESFSIRSGWAHICLRLPLVDSAAFLITPHTWMNGVYDVQRMYSPFYSRPFSSDFIREKCFFSQCASPDDGGSRFNAVWPLRRNYFAAKHHSWGVGWTAFTETFQSVDTLNQSQPNNCEMQYFWEDTHDKGGNDRSLA